MDDDVQFTWDPGKAAANFSKHGVSFGDASTVFRNLRANVLPDPIDSEQEHCSLIIGHSVGGRLLPGSLHGVGRSNPDHQRPRRFGARASRI